MSLLPEITEKTDHLPEKASHIADQISKIFSNENVRALNGVVGKLSKKYGDTESEENSPSTQQGK